jgi:hypothetical protein
MDVSDAEQLEHERWRPPNAVTSRTIATTVTGAAAREPLPDAAVQALAALNDEIAALRSRLNTAERALGLPAPRYGPALPDLPALLRRVSALERRSGVIPGLAPLPGLEAQPPSAVVADVSAGRAGRVVWQGLAGGAVAVFLIVLAFLPFPGSGTKRIATSPVGACHAASVAGVLGEGCLPAVTPTPAARPALSQVATATPAPTAEDSRFQQETMVPPTLVPSGIWTAPCRAGSSTCIPDENYPTPGTHGTGPADEYGTP